MSMEGAQVLSWNQVRAPGGGWRLHEGRSIKIEGEGPRQTLHPSTFILILLHFAAFLRYDRKEVGTLAIDAKKGFALGLACQPAEVGHGSNSLAIDAFNHVALLQALLCGWAVGIELVDYYPANIGG